MLTHRARAVLDRSAHLHHHVRAGHHELGVGDAGEGLDPVDESWAGAHERGVGVGVGRPHRHAGREPLLADEVLGQRSGRVQPVAARGHHDDIGHRGMEVGPLAPPGGRRGEDLYRLDEGALHNLVDLGRRESGGQLPERLEPDHPHRTAILEAHRAAIEAGEPGYLDPVTGLFVITAAEHVRRGPCRANDRRHCPYR